MPSTAIALQFFHRVGYTSVESRYVVPGAFLQSLRNSYRCDSRIKWPPRQYMLFWKISSAVWAFQDDRFSCEESWRELVYSRFQPSRWFSSLFRPMVKASFPMTHLLVSVEAGCARGPRHARSSCTMKVSSPRRTSPEGRRQHLRRGRSLS